MDCLSQEVTLGLSLRVYLSTSSVGGRVTPCWIPTAWHGRLLGLVLTCCNYHEYDLCSKLLKSITDSTADRTPELTPVADADTLARLNNLGISFLTRFERTGDLNDISQAIENQQHAIRLTPDGHADKPAIYNNLGISFFHRFQRIGHLDDLSEAIRSYRHAIHCTPEGDANLPTYLTHLGSSFSSRFQQTGDQDDISQAIENQRLALRLIPDGHPNKPGLNTNLGISYYCRFERTGGLDDIYEAINNFQHAIQLTPDGHSDMPSRLINLGNSFSARFDRTGDLDDINQAIKNQQLAIQNTPDGHPNLQGFLLNLGISLSNRFQRTGDLDDISQAIEYQQHSVRLTPDGHPNLPSRLDSLGGSFTARFQCTGDLDDIFEAIKHHQRAVQLIPNGHVNLPARLNNLGNSFSTRFERTGDLHDISEAIEHQRRAVQLTPYGDPSKPGHLSNLGVSLFRRFRSTGDLDDISESIKNLQHAIQYTPDGHVNLPGYFQNLGASFLSRSEHTGDLVDISGAIKHQQHAILLTPDGHADLPSRLNNLGRSYSSRFEHTGCLDDISEAIKSQQHAVQLLPDGHANKPALLNNLGHSFLSHFERSGDVEFLANAVSSYRTSANSTIGAPSVRLLAATQWAMLSQQSPLLSSQLLDALACGIHLLSLVSGLEDTIQRRHQSLINFSRLSIAASAAALSHGHSDLALEWLVEGRCIVWNQITQLRTPVDKLRVHNQSLADRFSAVSMELENAGSRSESRFSSPETTLSMDQRASLEEQAGKHMKLAKERDQLLVTIRGTPGFEDFLLPKKCADIMSGLPNEGPVVIVNIHDTSCDALALIAGASEPVHIPLSNFSYQEAERLAKGFQSYLLRLGLISRKGTVGAPRDPPSDVDLAEVLSALWSQVVWPILESLAFSVRFTLVAVYSISINYFQLPDTKSCANMPRIWWCPTGPLAFLPIHAAGIYVKGEGVQPNQCLAEFAVSSYIPTVNANLKPSKSNSVEKPGGAPTTGLLIVSQPNTPNNVQILGAKEEADRIGMLLGKRRIPSCTLVDQSGTVEGVLNAMGSFPSIHLACHASQDTTSPLKSSIHLHDGPLELSEIVKINLTDSDLAFLSACQTSTGDKNLPEEVVHIAAGMLAAGYQSVVGTMWSISDKHGPDIAESFYESLLDDGGGGGSEIVDGAKAARALHRAVGRFRENNSDSLHVWVPYIHIGI